MTMEGNDAALNILNILNGQAMYDHFKHHNLNLHEEYIPFNEAMCVGMASIDIFSDEFINNRCKAHNVTFEQYSQITLEPIKLLLQGQFDSIVLWFDEDMFCQINILTILAYLEQINFIGQIKLNLVGEGFEVIESQSIRLKGYLKLYEQVLINHKQPQHVELPSLERGIKLYLEYIKEDNAIIEYIRQHENLPKDMLVTKLIKSFSEYGLGDTQYIELINKHTL